MIRFNLTSKELARVQRAAEFAGFPWRPICTRPKTARQFYKRVEAEMHCEPKLSRSLIARRNTFIKFLCRRVKTQGLPWPIVQLTSDIV